MADHDLQNQEAGSTLPPEPIIAFVGRDLARIERLRIAVMATPFLREMASVSLTLPDLLAQLSEMPIALVALAMDLVNGDQARLLWIQQQLDEAPTRPYLVQVPVPSGGAVNPTVAQAIALIILAALRRRAEQ
jgi:hypothetical protein